jgi:hypothetical protein
MHIRIIKEKKRGVYFLYCVQFISCKLPFKYFGLYLSSKTCLLVPGCLGTKQLIGTPGNQFKGKGIWLTLYQVFSSFTLGWSKPMGDGSFNILLSGHMMGWLFTFWEPRRGSWDLSTHDGTANGSTCRRESSPSNVLTVL